MDRHDNAPPLADRLALQYEGLATEAADVTADAPPVETDETFAAYTSQARDLKDLVAKIEKARKSEKDAFLRDGRIVDQFFTVMAKPVRDAAAAFVYAINAWQTKKLMEERAAQRQAEEAAKVFDVPAPVPVAAPAAARLVAASGHVAATASTVWVHRVVDPAKVPRVYLEVSDAAIKAAIAGGVREIPGIEITEQVRTRIL